MNPREQRIGAAGLVLGHATLIALSVLALQHAVLRSTYGDTAFQFFEWLVRPDFQVPAHRYTAALPHMVVSALAHAGLSLRALMWIGSLVPVLVAYGIFIVCAHVWRARVAAVACALAAVLCTRLTFYDPVLEANWLLCFPFLFMGRVMRQGPRRSWNGKDLAIAALFLVIPLNAHPAGWMIMLAMVLLLLVNGDLQRREALISAAVIVVWTVLMALIAPPTSYERAQYDLAFRGVQQLGDAGAWASTRFLLDHSFVLSSTYLPALLVAVAVLLGWALRRRWWQAFALVGTAIAFSLVYLVTLHAGDTAVMMDRGILPLAVILGTSAALLMAELPRQSWLSVALAVVLFVKLRDVSFASRPFEERSAAVLRMIEGVEGQGASKALVAAAELENAAVRDTWALPCESILLSALRGPERAVVLMADQGHRPSPDELLVLGIPFQLAQSDERLFRPAPGPYVSWP